MRSRWDRKEDSLDLLLNTLCDVFGSFILIALILVLPTGIKQIAKSSVDIETLKRRIATAQSESQSLDARIASISPDEKIRGLEIEKNRLEKSIAYLQNSRTAVDAERTKQLNAASRDIAKEDADQQNAIKQALMEQEIAKNAIDAAVSHQTELSSRIDSLKGQVNNAKKSRVQQMRLPRERETSKLVLNVVFKYGQIYPLQSSPSDMEKNEQAIKWIAEGDESYRIEPLEGKGISSSDTAAISQWASKVSSDCFVACYVFPDSIDAFRGFRKSIQDHNIEVGWEPVEFTRKLLFGSGGTSPKPQ